MNQNEFKLLVLPFKDKLFRLSYAMLESRAKAKDLVQDVYLKLWDMRDDLAAYDSIEALAMKITKNQCIDRLRSYRSRHKNEEGLQHLTIRADEGDPGHVLEMNETMQQVHQLIALLPNRQRLILHLRDIEQYDYDEIETMTGMSRNNIRVTLSRARKRVQKEYLKIQDYEQ